MRKGGLIFFSYHPQGKHICVKSSMAVLINILTAPHVFTLFTLKQLHYDLCLSLIRHPVFYQRVQPSSMLPDSGNAQVSHRYLQKAICQASLLGLLKIASR